MFASEIPDDQMVGSSDLGAVSGEASPDDVVVYGSDSAMLADISAQLADITTPSLFNPDSTQSEYFKTYLASRPFCDYVVCFDGSQDYVMYYGYGITDSADYVRIYRTNSGSGYNYVYTVTTGYGAIPTSNVYVDTREGVNAYAEIEAIKMQAFACVCIVLLLALWVLATIFFR